MLSQIWSILAFSCDIVSVADWRIAVFLSACECRQPSWTVLCSRSVCPSLCRCGSLCLFLCLSVSLSLSFVICLSLCLSVCSTASMSVTECFKWLYVHFSSSNARCLVYQGRVANPGPVARIKTGRVARPITDAADTTGLGMQHTPELAYATPLFFYLNLVYA